MQRIIQTTQKLRMADNRLSNIPAYIAKSMKKNAALVEDMQKLSDESNTKPTSKGHFTRLMGELNLLSVEDPELMAKFLRKMDVQEAQKNGHGTEKETLETFGANDRHAYTSDGKKNIPKS